VCHVSSALFLLLPSLVFLAPAPRTLSMPRLAATSARIKQYDDTENWNWNWNWFDCLILKIFNNAP
jgi:hypothetical protein